MWANLSYSTNEILKSIQFKIAKDHTKHKINMILGSTTLLKLSNIFIHFAKHKNKFIICRTNFDFFRSLNWCVFFLKKQVMKEPLLTSVLICFSLSKTDCITSNQNSSCQHSHLFSHLLSCYSQNSHVDLLYHNVQQSYKSYCGLMVQNLQFYFFKLGFTPCMTEQPLQGMKLQQKDKMKIHKSYRKAI